MVLAALPYCIIPLLSLNFEKLQNNENFQRYFVSFIADLKLSKRSYLTMTILFFLRRQVFALSAVFLEGSPILQINIMFVQSLVMLSYLLSQRPFETPLMNRLEYFNEFCILVMTYPTLLFSGYFNSPPSLQYNVGWAMICVMLTNTLVNFFIAFKESCRGMKIAVIVAYRMVKKALEKRSSKVYDISAAQPAFGAT